MQAFKKTLKSLYTRTLKILNLMPEDSGYRKHTTPLIQGRLNAVCTVSFPSSSNHWIQKISDIPKLEKTIDCGQIEEVIVQAQREYDLSRSMLKWKPWEPLVEAAPENQWKWPI